ncbi:MAG: PAS domain S-box protein [Bdellovibrionales bacterium]|nr:PAS domain S-box protein [Bdellovibrionales bacterium]
MAKLEVIDYSSNRNVKHKIGDIFSLVSRIDISHAIRLTVLSMILLSIFFFKFYQVDFINTTIWQPILLLLVATFFINAVGVIFTEQVGQSWWFNALLFTFDTIVIAALVAGLGVGKSLFVFLFLTNIILCGFVYGKQGAFYLALWTAIVFNTVTLFGSDIVGISVYASTVLNNISFFAVAALSGMFSRQIEVGEVEIERQSDQIHTLTTLNDLIIENAASGIISTDKEGLITFCNKSAEKILESDQLRGQRLTEVVPGLSGIVGDSDQGMRYEVNFENSKGETLLLEVIASVLAERSGPILGRVYMLQDQTELKRLEFSLRQKEKLAAVGQLAAGIAHEIRNPLASISGSIQLLSQGNELKGEDLRLMRIVVREIDRLNTLISEFLLFVRPESIPDEPVSISAVIKEVIELVKVNEQLNFEFEPKLELREKQLIFGHKDKLKQALLNMVINGIHALENTSEPLFQIKSYDEQDKVVLVIQDNGCGMTPENQRRIFEPFHTTKSKGTGLGMAITHKILESHNASIFVQSEVYQGTTFTIEFPVADNPLPNEEQEKVTA